MVRIALALAIFWAALLTRPHLIHADRSSKKRADQRLADGLALYQERKYDEAIVLFREGYEIEPRREFLYALGQAERLSGDCGSAIIYYRQFISRNPPERAAAAAFEQIASCEKALASSPQAPGDPAQARLAPTPESELEVENEAEVAPTTARAWYHDIVGDALLGGGSVLLLTSAAYYATARSASDAAAKAESYPEFDRLANRASSRRNTAIGLALGGSLLVGAAVYRFVWSGSSGTERRLVAAPVEGGAVVGIGGGF